MKSKTRATSWAMKSYLRVTSSKARVRKLKERVAWLKARAEKVKARVKAIKPRVKNENSEFKILNFTSFNRSLISLTFSQFLV